MKYLNNFLRDKKEICYILAFTLFFVVLCFLTWGKWGDPFVDCGREAYVPHSMLQGKLLIRDIFNLYNPLSLQINAILYKLFGEKLTVLYSAGIINSYLIILISYAIARALFKPIQAIAVLILIMAFGVFQINIDNYILPYSYSVVYAITGLLASVLFGIYAIKNRDSKNFNNFMYLAFFALSFSLANKFDYAMVVLPLLAIPIGFKKFKLKEYCYSFLALIILPLISYSILFLQGLTVQEFINYIHFGKRFFDSKTLLCFYSRFFLFSYTHCIFLQGLNLFEFSLRFVLGYIAVWLCLIKPFKIENFIGAIVLTALNINIINCDNKEFLLCWAVPFILIFLFLYVSTKAFKELIKDESNIISIFIIFSAILTTVRTAFFINSYLFGAFMMPLVLIALFIVFSKFFPIVFKMKNPQMFNQIITILFIIFGFIMLYKNLDYNKKFNAPLYSNKGVIYSTKEQTYVLSHALAYIDKKVAKDATCLVLPEGAMINFISGRKSVDKYYNLLPNHIEALGETNIVKDLEKTPPDYIFITNRTSAEFNKGYFCEDYAKKICSFVDDNYQFKEKFSLNKSDIWHDKVREIRIYKLKQYGL